MTKYLTLLLGILFISWNEPFCRKDRSYYPLEVGNTWTYVDTLPNDHERMIFQVKIAKDTLIRDHLYYVQKYQAHTINNTRFLRSENDAVYELNISTGQEYTVVPSAGKITQTYSIERDSIVFQTTSRV